MYALLTESKQSIQHYDVSGTIGSKNFVHKNVFRNSFSLANQISSPSEFRLGGAHIGQLNITMMGVNISRNNWEGEDIAPVVTIGNTDIPVGVFRIDSAKHSNGMVALTAYDRMEKFDKTFGLSVGISGQPYDLLVTACEECGVTFGMTREEVEVLPNGNLELFLLEIGDIETWRDFIYWIAVSLCSFAVMDRAGNLILGTFHNSVDDTIPHKVRYTGSTYGDEIIRYTGVNVFVTADNSIEYHSAEVDDGYTLNIGNNPFFQTTKAQRKVYVDNIVNALSEIQFNACSVRIPFGFQYDLGDVLQFPNGQGSATNKFCVMGYSFKYNGDCVLSGIPGQKHSQSKTDKNLQGLMSSVSKNEFTSYELRNIEKIVIGDNERERIIHARIASNADTKAQIHIEVNLESEADEGEDVTKGIVSYLINSEEVEFYPTETWIDGKHVLHLMYIMPLDANVLQEFDVYLKSMGGTLTIQRRGVWLYASGAGLVGDGKWDGTITVEDDVTSWTIPVMAFVDATDSVNVAKQTPTGDEISDTASVWVIPTISFEDANDDMYIEMHTDVFRRITEDGSIRVTEDGDVRYTEGD